jgi:hypothetical protein
MDMGTIVKTKYKVITCNDGTTLSVQASETHYCQPRSDIGPYLSVEIGFPSVAPRGRLLEHIDGGDIDPTDTVYGYVPWDVVREYIFDEHDGIESGELPPMIGENEEKE